jgi:hypothetical protein
LPIDFSHAIHWNNTYGSVGHDLSMSHNEFILGEGGIEANAAIYTSRT